MLNFPVIGYKALTRVISLVARRIISNRLPGRPARRAQPLEDPQAL